MNTTDTIQTPVPDTYPELEGEEIRETAERRNTMRRPPEFIRWVSARPTIPAPPPSLADTTEADEAWSSDSLDIEIDLDDPDLDIEVLFDSIRIAEAMVDQAVEADDEEPVSTERSRIAQVADRCNEERWSCFDEDPDPEEVRRADYILDARKDPRS